MSTAKRAELRSQQTFAPKFLRRIQRIGTTNRRGGASWLTAPLLGEPVGGRLTNTHYSYCEARKFHSFRRVKENRILTRPAAFTSSRVVKARKNVYVSFPSEAKSSVRQIRFKTDTRGIPRFAGNDTGPFWRWSRLSLTRADLFGTRPSRVFPLETEPGDYAPIMPSRMRYALQAFASP